MACPVCLDVVNRPWFTWSACKHVVRLSCLDRWRSADCVVFPNCPVCRAECTAEDEEEMQHICKKYNYNRVPLFPDRQDEAGEEDGIFDDDGRRDIATLCCYNVLHADGQFYSSSERFMSWIQSRSPDGTLIREWRCLTCNRVEDPNNLINRIPEADVMTCSAFHSKGFIIDTRTEEMFTGCFYNSLPIRSDGFCQWTLIGQLQAEAVQIEDSGSEAESEPTGNAVVTAEVADTVLDIDDNDEEVSRALLRSMLNPFELDIIQKMCLSNGIVAGDLQ